MVHICLRAITMTPIKTDWENVSEPRERNLNISPRACMLRISMGMPEIMPIAAVMMRMLLELYLNAKKSGCVLRSYSLPHIHTGLAMTYRSMSVRKL